MVTETVHISSSVNILHGVYSATGAVPQHVAVFRSAVELGEVVQISRRVEGAGSPYVEVLGRIPGHGPPE